MKRLFVSAGLALMAASPAAAHVVVSPNRADTGSYFAGAFRVGHGCEEQATTALRIEIPKEVISARPKAVPGWKVAIERDGKEWDARVVAITWTGRLPDEQFQDFEVLMKLPAKDGPLYFPVVQTCGKAQSKWIEIPDGGGATLSHPAPRLDIGPAPAPAGTHNH